MFCVILIVLVTSFGDKAVLFVKETVEQESSRTHMCLWLLTMLMVSEMHSVTGDSLVVGQFLVHSNCNRASQCLFERSQVLRNRKHSQQGR